MTAIILPPHSLVAGDGEVIGYEFAGKDFTTGHSLAMEVRERRTVGAATRAALATFALDATYDADADVTTMFATLSEADSRVIGSEAWTDLQVTPDGGKPHTVFQQRLLVSGDVTK